MTQALIRDNSRHFDRSMARANALVEIKMLADCTDCTADFMRQEIARILAECETKIHAVNNGN